MPVPLSMPLPSDPGADRLAEAAAHAEQGKDRVVLTRGGEAVAAVVPITDLRALEELDGTTAIEVDQEDDGRWIAEVAMLPGVLAYGATEAEARARAIALAFRVVADRIEHGETVPDKARALLPVA
jgi:predicted RNase H-like HicB family nuclease